MIFSKHLRHGRLAELAIEAYITLMLRSLNACCWVDRFTGSIAFLRCAYLPSGPSSVHNIEVSALRR